MPDAELNHRLRLLEDSLSRAIGGMNMLIEANANSINRHEGEIKELRGSLANILKELQTLNAQRAVEAVHFEYVRKEATGAHAIAKEQALNSAKDVAGTERFKASLGLQAAIGVAIVTGLLNLLKEFIVP